uniref:DNA-directed DNA polymerase n=1 Tax=Netrium digitus TaxID=43946 RepID=A0A191T575_9VIRI|nr:putative DNA polymerase type B [Netrium digitus]ANI25551.1 putative DNA polymerase type B [Netrium digitus]
MNLVCCESFSNRINLIINNFSFPSFKKIKLCTFYSNAELSALFPTLKDYASLKHAQGDKPSEKISKYRRDTNNLNAMDILGSPFVTGYRYKLNYPVDILDARHIYSQSNLDDLGKGLRIPKVHGIDFTIKNANQWLEDSSELFLDYASIDAVIPVEAIINMHLCKNNLAIKLAEQDILMDSKEPDMKRFLAKSFLTTASIADNLIYLALKKQGVLLDFKEFQRWDEFKLPYQAAKTKGGLNKVFVITPTLIENVDQYDISGAYATAMKNVKLPLSEPIVIGSHIAPIKILAQKLDSDEVQHALINLSFELNDDSTEWERPLIIYDYENNVGFTGAKTDKNQWFTLLEILALAEINPDIEVEVIQGYISTNERTKSYVDIADLYNAFKILRKEYKSKGVEGDAMQTTIKLVGNAGYGKTLQKKSILNTGFVDNSILTNSPISVDTHSNISQSKIYSSVWGNAITAYVRAVLAITAYHNKAYMAVTDSIVCDHAKFIPSANIHSNYKKLKQALNDISWECDFTNVNFVIHKERDYYSFTIKKNCNRDIIKDLKSGVPGVPGVPVFFLVLVTFCGNGCNSAKITNFSLFVSFSNLLISLHKKRIYAIITTYRVFIKFFQKNFKLFCLVAENWLVSFFIQI